MEVLSTTFPAAQQRWNNERVCVVHLVFACTVWLHMPELCRKASWSGIPSCIAPTGSIMNNQALCVQRSAQASAQVGAASRQSQAVHQLGGPEEEPRLRLTGRPLSTRVDVACPLAQRSPAGAALEPVATPVLLLAAKGDTKCWKCGLYKTARIPINSSAPVIPHKRASRCRLQCTWPSASTRC
jgi:hypothetical protein